MATRPADALDRDALALDGVPRSAAPVVPLWKAATLYVGVPVVLCVYASLNNWKLLEASGLAATLAFYLAHMAVPWTVTAILTHGAWRLMAPWRPGLAVITLVGSVLGCILTIPYAGWVTYLMEGGSTADVGASAGWLPTWGKILGSMARTYAIWVGVNFVFDRYLGYPRYRYAEPVAVPPDLPSPASLAPDAGPASSARPPFMARLTRPADLDSLLAIHAEQHYIQVITRSGQELVLYRMSDAVSQLPDALGIQVHRSWWVSRRAIESVRTSGKKMHIRLCNGLEVPVSAPYQALARRIAADNAR